GRGAFSRKGCTGWVSTRAFSTSSPRPPSAPETRGRPSMRSSARGRRSPRARGSRAGSGTPTPRRDGGWTRSPSTTASSSALAAQDGRVPRFGAGAARARGERAMRGRRYQPALDGAGPPRAARLLLALAREDPSFLPAWVGAGDVLAQSGRRVRARRVWER